MSVSDTKVTSAQPDGCDVFISYRVAEADKEAKLLKAKLATLGITAFVSSVDIPHGANKIRLIAKNMDSCR